MSEAAPTTEAKSVSKEDLQVFLQKRGTVTRAQLDLNMIVDGYEAWVVTLRERYNLTDEAFEIDPQTGEINQPASKTPSEPVTDG